MVFLFKIGMLLLISMYTGCSRHLWTNRTYFITCRYCYVIYWWGVVLHRGELSQNSQAGQFCWIQPWGNIYFLLNGEKNDKNIKLSFALGTGIAYKCIHRSVDAPTSAWFIMKGL